MFVYFRGWDQLEATCNPNMREPKALWSVEEITDNRCKDHTCTCSIDCVTKIKFGLITGIKKKIKCNFTSNERGIQVFTCTC